jgi:hypothetical protein
MIRRLILVAAVLSGALSAAAGPARAADFDFAACDPTAVTATATWSPGLTPVVVSQTFSLSVDATCTGPGDEAGHWAMSFAGTGPEDCGSGSGSGTVNGVNSTSTEAWSLGFTYQRIGPMLVVTAGPGGAEGDIAGLTWLAPSFMAPCPATSQSYMGVVATADTTPPAAPTALHVTGSGSINPGLSLVPVVYPVIWSFSGSATGVFNGVPGSCTLTAYGNGLASGTVTESGTGSGTCNGSGGIAISCPSFNYSRVGTVVAVDGSCTGPGSAGGSMTGRLAFTPTSLIPTTSFTLDGGVAIS